MNPPDLPRIRARALEYAVRHGRAEVAQDFAQWVILRALEGRSVCIYTAIVDFEREYFGDFRSAPGRMQAEERRTSGDPEQVASPEPLPSGAYAYVLQEIPMDRTDRACFVLHYHWGMTQAEIADALGVTHSLVSHRLTLLIRCARERLRVDPQERP